MNGPTLEPEVRETEQSAASGEPAAGRTPWETPVLEDVSEQVMAQPYIRFT
jgi:hypothetical protein